MFPNAKGALNVTVSCRVAISKRELPSKVGIGTSIQVVRPDGGTVMELSCCVTDFAGRYMSASRMWAAIAPPPADSAGSDYPTRWCCLLEYGIGLVFGLGGLALLVVCGQLP